MLSRLTPAAKEAVARAYELSQRDRAPEIGEEHLLRALVESAEGRHLLGAAGEDEAVGQILDEVAQARRRAGLTSAEVVALAEFGVDLDAVVRRVEDALGAGALARPGSGAPRRWKRPVMSVSVIRSLGEAERHMAVDDSRSLDVEHAVLGVVSAPSVVAEALARRGVTVEAIRAAAKGAPRGGGR